MFPGELVDMKMPSPLPQRFRFNSSQEGPKDLHFNEYL